MQKKGSLIGLIVFFLLVLYQIMSMHGQVRWDIISSGKGILIMVLGPIIGGVLSGFVIQNYFLTKLARRGSVYGAITGSLFISPLSLYYAIVVSTIGGGLGEKIGSMFGAEATGIYLGIFTMIISVIIIVELVGATISSILGFLIESLIRRIS